MSSFGIDWEKHLAENGGPDGVKIKTDNVLLTPEQALQKGLLTENASASAIPTDGSPLAQHTPEGEFLHIWQSLDGPDLEQEFRFHDTRRWRFDFALPSQMIAIEIEGGAWTQGRHNRGKGFIEDCHKYNNAQMLGWRVYRLATGMVRTEFVQPIIDSVME